MEPDGWLEIEMNTPPHGTPQHQLGSSTQYEVVKVMFRNLSNKTWQLQWDSVVYQTKDHNGYHIIPLTSVRMITVHANSNLYTAWLEENTVKEETKDLDDELRNFGKES